MDFDKYQADSILEQQGGCSNSIICAMIVCVIIVLAFCSCKTTYVPVETVVKEYIHTTDTVREKDTVRNEKETVIREMSAADSAMLAKLGLEVKENQHIILVLQKELERQSHEKQEARTDTVFRDKEVQVPYPVERKLTKWEQFFRDFGAVSFCVFLGGVAFVIIMLIRWLRKRSLLKG